LQVFIRADDQVAYGEVIRTMAAIKAAGIENVGMVTQEPSGKGGPDQHERGKSKP
jgi:biopolymer transport protein TolR